MKLKISLCICMGVSSVWFGVQNGHVICLEILKIFDEPNISVLWHTNIVYEHPV